jgi:hypothetical protein
VLLRCEATWPLLTVHMPLAEFLEHVCVKFNMLSREMDSPLCRLALFLDVRYKDAVPSSISSRIWSGRWADSKLIL